MTIHLIVGLPGSGKTTHARDLAAATSALRLTPDEWYWSVFPDDGPDRWRSPDRVDQRDRLEGRLVGVGLRAAVLGVDVVFDFGLWSRDERSALRWIAESLGVGSRVVYLPVGVEEQRRRVSGRLASGPGQFAFSDTELVQWRARFDEPDAEELHGGSIPPVPPGHPSWLEWAHRRWPSLPRT